MAHLNRNRSRLLIGCGSAALAISLALVSERAHAQAIQATDNVVSGSANREVTGSTSETIQVDTLTAVIEWTPFEDAAGNALDFLPAIGAVTYQSTSDFAVLNIILPATNGNVTVIDGTLISQIDFGSGAVTPGGTVVLYSPSGILVGANASFDVGNLILTTLEPDLASFDDFAINGGTLTQFGDGSTASIIINPGAQITATAENSYFAVTAAEIQMFGAADINGSHAYVAGEAVNLTVSNGLFDIQIPIGTTVATPIQIDGDVGGPSSTGITGDNHLIYAVAAAQIDPISMIFRGNLGFDAAASAGIVNGEIILSANYEVNGRNVDGGSVADGNTALFDADSSLTDIAGSIFLEDFGSTSTILAIANEEVQVTAFNGPSSVDGNLIMVGRNFSELTASNGQQFDITGDVFVSADAFGRIDFSPITGEIDAVGGQAFIDAFGGGTLDIDGDVVVSAGAIAGVDQSTLQSGTATGGNATIAANGGTLSIAGFAEVVSSASEAQISDDFLFGAEFNAGVTQLFATQGGQVTIDGDVFLTSDAHGTVGDIINPSTTSNTFSGVIGIQTIDDGSALILNGNVIASAQADAGVSNDSVQGGLADGGDIFINVGDLGLVDIAGELIMQADAIGGDNQDGQGGNAFGGASRILVPNGGAVTIDGNVTATGDAFGGNGIGGGDAFGGVAGVQAVTGSIDILGALELRAQGQGGESQFGFGGNGGNGTGGAGFLQADGTVAETATVNIGQRARINVSGIGGAGGLGDGSALNAGRGGDGFGGDNATVNQADTNLSNGAFMIAGGNNGRLTVGPNSSLTATGSGGIGGTGGAGQAGGDGGDGFGGFALLGLEDLNAGDFSLAQGQANFADILVLADGNGAAGGAGGTAADDDGNGGAGVGGETFLAIRGGDVITGTAFLSVAGVGGAGNTGGNATAGMAFAGGNAGGTLSTTTVSFFATAFGGQGVTQGGNAVAGDVGFDFDADDLTITTTGNVVIGANATGGNAVAGRGGDATGGNAGFSLLDDNSSLDVGSGLFLQSNAQAGSSATMVQGASATGGNAGFSVLGLGSVGIANTVVISAAATGGDNSLGQGGDAFGGAARIFVPNGGSVLIGTNYNANGRATGGAGLGGGDAFGGLAGAQVTLGLIDIDGNVDANTAGIAGDATFGFGGDGGNGTGGNSFLQADGTLTETGTVDVAGNVTLLANGAGGDGGLGDGSIIAAGRGGDGTGGNQTTPNQFDPNLGSGAFLLAGGDNGSVIITGTSLLNAVGTGGEGGVGGLGQSGGDGGNGLGGEALAGLILVGTDGSVGSGTANFGMLNLIADGFAGNGGIGSGTGASQGAGGIGTGSRAQVVSSAGSLVADSVTTAANGIGGSGANGGAGNAGDASGILTDVGGSITISSYSGFALGVGGDGFTGFGGEGIGGTAFLDFQDGTTQVNGNVIINASGTGGNSVGGDGANGTGGTASIAMGDPTAGAATISGHATVFSNGTGGDAGDTFTGGAGSGGSAFVQVQAGSSVTLASAQVVASGLGGSGLSANGGAGFGGAAEIVSEDAGSQVIIQNSTPFGLPNNGPLTQSNSLIVSAGVGGNATGGLGVGGLGTGGEATVRASAGGTVALPADPANDVNGGMFNRIIARGVGGGSSVDGGAGGNGFGGNGTITADGGGIITSGATLFSTFGQGGFGLDTIASTDGGNGEGGQRIVRLTNNSSLTIELSGGTNAGIGGSGSFQGDGGDGIGGSVELNLDDSELNLVGQSLFIDQSMGGLGTIGGEAIGGTVEFTATNSTINIIPSAGGAALVVIGGIAFGGEGMSDGGSAAGADIDVGISETSISGGSLIVTGGAVGGAATDGDGAGGDATGGNVDFSAINSDLDLIGLNTIEATAIGGNGDTGGNATGGNIIVDLLNGSFEITSGGSSQGILGVATDATGGEGTTQSGNAQAGTSQFIGEGTRVDLDELNVTAQAGSTANISGSAAGIATAGAAEVQFNGTTGSIVRSALRIFSDATSAIDGTAIAGTADLVVGRSDITGSPELNIVDLELSADASGGFTGSTSTNMSGTFSILAQQGIVSIDNINATALGDITPGETGDPSFRAVGGNIRVSDSIIVDVLDTFNIETGLGSILGGPNTLDPSVDVDITSQGSIIINGDDDNSIGFSGEFVRLASNDIVIEDGVRIGAAMIDFVSLNFDDPAILGGTGAPSGGVTGEGYALIAEELNRLEVETANFAFPFLAAGGSNPDVIIRDVAFTGSLDDGVSNVFIDVGGADGGIARIEGLVEFLDAATSDTFNLRAADRIEIVTPGGIQITNLTDNPSGTLFLQAEDIWVADAALITQLQTDPNFAGRSDQLSVAAAGSDDPLGYLRGGNVQLGVGQSLLVRNTGTATDQGGILVEDGGLSIFRSDDAIDPTINLDVFAYGARVDAMGNLIIGEAFFGEVDFGTAGGANAATFIADAEFNDCLINTADCGTAGGTPGAGPVIGGGTPPTTLIPEQASEALNNPAVVEAAITSVQPVTTTEQESNDEFGIDFPGLVEEPEQEEGADINDPVASGGDSSLYSQVTTGNVEVEGN